ncbi:MAG: hypothetical protein ACREBS_06390 [Nitrososphaerales archaeon]
MINNLRKKLVSGFIVIYSLLVMASSTPRFGEISNVPVILYFMFLPGLAMTMLFKESYSLLERFSFSVILSLGAVLTLLAIRQVIYPSNFPLPFEVIIPLITILIISYYYFVRPHQVRI